MNSRVKLQDIADELHLSKNTVSRALRDCSDIGEKTKILVKDKAKEMGYIPNALSIFLRENSSKLIGIVTSDLSNPYYCIHIDRLIKSLSGIGLVPITILTDSGYLDFNVLKSLLNYQVCAIISFQDYSQDTYEFLKDKNIPIYLYGLLSEHENTKSIYTDDYLGGVLVAREYIKSDKYKRPCMITWHNHTDTFRRRSKGFLDEMSKYNIPCDVIVTGYSNEKYDEIIKKYDFIFAYCDELGINFMEYKNKVSKKNIEIFGFDGLSFYNPINKTIKSISADADSMVKYVTKEIKQKLENPEYELKSKKFPVKLLK